MTGRPGLALELLGPDASPELVAFLIGGGLGDRPRAASPALRRLAVAAGFIVVAGSVFRALRVPVGPAPMPMSTDALMNRLTIGQFPPSTGAGYVLGPGGLRCRISAAGAAGACSTQFPLHALVLLRAVPDSDSRFVGWGGSCLGASTTPTCTLGMTMRGYGYDPQARFAHR